MTIPDICNFIKNYKDPPPLVKTFNLEEDESFSDIDEKTVRSAIVRFHLTTETPLLVSYSHQKISIFKNIREINLKPYLGGIIFRLTALTTCAATFSYGLYILNSKLDTSSNDDIQDALSQDHLTKFPEDFNSRIKTSNPLFGIFLGQVLTIQIISLYCFSVVFKEIYNTFHTVCYKNFHTIDISFKREERFFDKHIANNETIDTTAYIDPISFDEIPKDKTQLRRYLHPTNYVTDISSCIKTILMTDLKTDARGLKYTEHPFERGELDTTSRLALENEICETFGLDNISKFYECWGVNASEKNEINQRKRVLKFLNLFETDIHKLLPLLQPPQPDEDM